MSGRKCEWCGATDKLLPKADECVDSTVCANRINERESDALRAERDRLLASRNRYMDHLNTVRAERDALKARVEELEARHTDETLRQKAADLQTSKVRGFEKRDARIAALERALGALRDWPENGRPDFDGDRSITGQDLSMRTFARAALAPTTGAPTPREKCSAFHDGPACVDRYDSTANMCGYCRTRAPSTPGHPNDRKLARPGDRNDRLVEHAEGEWTHEPEPTRPVPLERITRVLPTAGEIATRLGFPPVSEAQQDVNLKANLEEFVPTPSRQGFPQTPTSTPSTLPADVSKKAGNIDMAGEAVEKAPGFIPHTKSCAQVRDGRECSCGAGYKQTYEKET